MEAKIFQKPLLEASWGLLGRSWGLLGASWAQDPKKSKKVCFFKLNLGAKIDEKSKKIDVKKALVLRHVFFMDFLRFCIDFGSSKPSFWDRNWL